jgi:pyruvate/2-oxoglutarate dehydrogenase complex dihydrolipoamide dehydrogenase (E3) component
LAEVSYFTSDTIFDNETLPAHLLVVGAGAVGLELAQAFSRLGSQVTVLEALRPLPGSDPELTEIVLDACRREHIEIIAPCRIMSARKSPEGLTLSIETSGSVRELAASHLLIAAGRRPNLEGLGLETAGIAASARGIELTKGLKTSNPLVYAIGDVAAGDLNFTHVAAHQAGLVIKNALFRLPVTYDPAKMPWVIYTDPEFAHAGLSEVEAKDRGLDVNVLHWPLSRTDRARIERRTDGLLKIVLDRKGRVLGAGIVGLNAGELILPWCRMIEGGEKIRRMAESVIPYPTLSEASRRVALTKFQTLGSNAWVRRAIDVLTSIG